MEKYRVVPVDARNAVAVISLVAQLLYELGEEGDEAGTLDTAALAFVWREEADRHHVFLAYEGDKAIGVVTVSETFAFYANGRYGVINEMFVVPGHRSAGVGKLLVDAVKELGWSKGWRRVDVTAPEAARWSRTRAFYEKQGFTFAGPKSKFLL